MFSPKSFSVRSFSSKSFFVGLVERVKAAGRRLKRKRIFIDGETRFLNPIELAQILSARYARLAAEKSAVSAPKEALAHENAELTPDLSLIKSLADIRASQEFIAKMNAEFLRIREAQQQIEEDDEECLMLLAA